LAGFGQWPTNAARREAAVAAAAIIADAVRCGRRVRGHTFEVADESGQTVLTYAFTEACQDAL
jgi:hypothetical protein